MNIGELFVNLGIKGTEKTVGALGSVKKGLGEVSAMSLEAKAAILAALYGLERLTAASGAAGNNLVNMSALTGMSTKSIQQWDYAARQAGVSGQEMEGSIKGVKNAMTELLLHGTNSGNVAFVASKVGFDVTRARDTNYVLGQLQKFAQSVPPELANTVIKSFGISEGVVAAMRRNMFRPDVFAKAPTYSDHEVQNLDRAYIAWANLAAKIEMAVGHFNAMHGMQLVKDISQITDKVLALADALTTLANNLKVFTAISKAIGFVGEEAQILSWFVRLMTGEDAAKVRKDVPADSFMGRMLKKNDEAIRPLVAPHIPGSTAPQNIQINQNLNFQHDGKDHHKTGDSVHKSVKKAFRQMPAQRQGS